MDRIKAAYVEPVSDKTLLENAIKGMLSNLDPHSAYLEPEAFAELQESTSGEFGGLGIEVGMEDGFVKVVSPIDDTPASTAGIEAGDLIVKIDGQPTKGLSMMDAIGRCAASRAAASTDAGARGGQPFDVKLTRAVIKVRSVRSQSWSRATATCASLSSGQLRPGSGQGAGEAEEGQRRQELNGLVLDLRNNPGGVLQAAVEISDHF